MSNMNHYVESNLQPEELELTLENITTDFLVEASDELEAHYIVDFITNGNPSGKQIEQIATYKGISTSAIQDMTQESFMGFLKKTKTNIHILIKKFVGVMKRWFNKFLLFFAKTNDVKASKKLLKLFLSEKEHLKVSIKGKVLEPLKYVDEDKLGETILKLIKDKTIETKVKVNNKAPFKLEEDLIKPEVTCIYNGTILTVMRPSKVDEITKEYKEGVIAKVAINVKKEKSYTFKELNINHNIVVDYLSMSKKDVISIMDKTTKDIKTKTDGYKKDLDNATDENITKSIRANVISNLTFQTLQYSQILQRYKGIWKLVEGVKESTEEGIVKRYEDGEEGEVEIYNDDISIAKNIAIRLTNIGTLQKEDVIEAIQTSIKPTQEEQLKDVLKSNRLLDCFNIPSSLEDLQSTELTNTPSFVDILCIMDTIGLDYENNNWALNKMVKDILTINNYEEGVKVAESIKPNFPKNMVDVLVSCGDSKDELALYLSSILDIGLMKKVLTIPNNDYDNLYLKKELLLNVFGKKAVEQNLHSIMSTMHSFLPKGNPLSISNHKTFVSFGADKKFHMELVSALYKTQVVAVDKHNLNNGVLDVATILKVILPIMFKLMPNVNSDTLTDLYIKTNYDIILGKDVNVALDVESKEYKHIYGMAIEEFGNIVEEFKMTYGELPKGSLTKEIHESLCKRYAGVYHQLRNSVDDYRKFIQPIGDYGYGLEYPNSILIGFLILSNAIRREEIKNGKGFYKKAGDRLIAYIKGTGALVEGTKKKPITTKTVKTGEATIASFILDALGSKIDLSSLALQQKQFIHDSFETIINEVDSIKKTLFPSSNINIFINKDNIGNIARKMIENTIVSKQISGEFDSSLKFLQSKGMEETVVKLIIRDLLVNNNKNSYLTISDATETFLVTKEIYNSILTHQLNEFGGSVDSKEAYNAFLKAYDTSKNAKQTVVTLNIIINAENKMAMERVAEAIIKVTVDDKDSMKVLNETPDGKKVVKDFETIVGQRGVMSKILNKTESDDLEKVEVDVVEDDTIAKAHKYQHLYFTYLYDALLGRLHMSSRKEVENQKDELKSLLNKNKLLHPILTDNVIIPGATFDINRLMKFFPSITFKKASLAIRDEHPLQQILNTLYTRLTEGPFSAFYEKHMTHISYDVEEDGYKILLEEKEIKALSIIKVLREHIDEMAPNTYGDVVANIGTTAYTTNHMPEELKSLSNTLRRIDKALPAPAKERDLIPSIINVQSVYTDIYHYIEDNIENIFKTEVDFDPSTELSLSTVKRLKVLYVSQLRKAIHNRIYTPTMGMQYILDDASNDKVIVFLENLEKEMQDILADVKQGIKVGINPKYTIN